jgi:NADPH:quinone reductase-like Zn-dependent oxidoreductase
VNLELIKTLGADCVVDYTREDFTAREERYDIIFDTVGKTTFKECQGSLKAGGIYLNTVPTLAFFIRVLWSKWFGSKQVKFIAAGLRSPDAKTKDLRFAREMIGAGQFRAVIDRTYTLEQIAEAHRYVEKGHKKGNVVITTGQ